MLGGLDYHSIAVAVKRALTASYLYIASGSGSDGQALLRDSSQLGGISLIDNPARPNLLINPNFQIDQINEGTLYTMNGAAAVGPDGWSGEAVGGGGGVFKVRTLADPDNAALKCMEITCTTADVAIAAAERYSIFTAIEGYDVAALQAGVASGQPITVQFKFKSNVLGVYGVSIANSAKSRSYVGIITVADALEHEYSLSLTMDTAGAWLYTNGVGLYLRLTLAGGANFQAVAGAWAAADNYTTAAQCNFMSVNTNIAYLKRIQLIQGALVQAYKPADIQKELVRAQRYYEKSIPQGTAVAQNAGVNGAFSVGISAAAAGLSLSGPQYKQTKRATPTVTTYNPSVANANWRDPVGVDITVSAINASGDGGFYLTVDTGASAAGRVALGHYTANARLS